MPDADPGPTVAPPVPNDPAAAARAAYERARAIDPVLGERVQLEQQLAAELEELVALGLATNASRTARGLYLAATQLDGYELGRFVRTVRHFLAPQAKSGD